MGSTGGGNFSDYPRSKPTSLDANNGGTSGTDMCGLAFTTSLEEVSRCAYYMRTSDVPAVNTDLTISFNGSRLVVSEQGGEEIGYLPTKYNYLKICLSSNFTYSGFVNFSSLVPTPSIIIDVTPN